MSKRTLSLDEQLLQARRGSSKRHKSTSSSSVQSTRTTVRHKELQRGMPFSNPTVTPKVRLDVAKHLDFSKPDYSTKSTKPTLKT